MSKSPDTPPDRTHVVDWAEARRKAADSPELGDLVEQMSMQNPASDHCLDWPGHTDSRGRPQIRVNGKLQLVTRAVYELFSPLPLPPNAVVRQTCGNQLCVRQEHLWLDSKVGPLSRTGFGGKAPRLLPPPDARNHTGAEGGEGS